MGISRQGAGEPVSTLVHVWDFVRERAQLEPDEKGKRPAFTICGIRSPALASPERMSLPLIGRLLGHTQAAPRKICACRRRSAEGSRRQDRQRNCRDGRGWR